MLRLCTGGTLSYNAKGLAITMCKVRTEAVPVHCSIAVHVGTGFPARVHLPGPMVLATPLVPFELPARCQGEGRNAYHLTYYVMHETPTPSKGSGAT